VIGVMGVAQRKHSVAVAGFGVWQTGHSMEFGVMAG